MAGLPLKAWKQGRSHASLSSKDLGPRFRATPLLVLRFLKALEISLLLPLRESICAQFGLQNSSAL